MSIRAGGVRSATLYAGGVFGNSINISDADDVVALSGSFTPASGTNNLTINEANDSVALSGSFTPPSSNVISISEANDVVALSGAFAGSTSSVISITEADDIVLISGDEISPIPSSGITGDFKPQYSIYSGLDNTFSFALTKDGNTVDLIQVTRMVLAFSGTRIIADTNTNADFIKWTPSGVVTLKLGSLAIKGQRDIALIAYSPNDPLGKVIVSTKEHGMKVLFVDV